MKKTILIKLTMILIGIIIPTVNIYAAETDKTVTLVVSGEANSKDEAVKQALRSAIEQAFGTFVSANTQVLNDELIKDEIVTVSTGNITGYKEIDTYQTKDGNYLTTLEATVSIGNLTNFARSKGMSVELTPGAFVMNLKMRELNKQNEVRAIKDLINKMQIISDTYDFFDYTLTTGEPYIVHDNSGEEYYAITHKLSVIPNKNLYDFRNTLVTTLESLSLSPTEVVEYRKANLPYSEIELDLYNSYEDYIKRPHDIFKQPRKVFYLRNMDSKSLSYEFYDMILKNLLRFKIEDNNNNQVAVYYDIDIPTRESVFKTYPLIGISKKPNWSYGDIETDYRDADKLDTKLINYYLYTTKGGVKLNEDSKISPTYNFDIENMPLNESYIILTAIYPKDYFTRINNLSLKFSNPVHYKK